jgi:hypothetical protein
MAATAPAAIPATGTLRAEVVGSLLRPPELPDDRRAKLELVVEVARSVWG